MVLASAILLIGVVGEIGFFSIDPTNALAGNQKTPNVQDQENGPREGKENEKTAERITDAERILQLRKTIKRDKQELKVLAGNLKRLEENFKRYGNRLTDLKARIAEEKKRIADATKEGDTHKAERLQTEVKNFVKTRVGKRRDAEKVLPVSY